jgi:Sec-independent protein translocase protein TatA
MVGSFGAPELLCIVLLALIVSCPFTLPELVKSLAAAISQFKKEFHRTDRSATEPMPVLDKLPDTGQP